MQQTISPRREKTRQRLMESAAEVIAERGFLAASVEEICDRAGFTRGAFYSNFDSREALALALLRTSADAQLSSARAAIEQATREADDSVQGIVDRAVDAFVHAQPAGRDAVLLHVELRLHAVRNADFGHALARFDQEMTTLFEQTITVALRERGLTLAVPAQQAIDLLHAVHQHASLDELVPGSSDSGLGESLKGLLTALVRRV